MRKKAAIVMLQEILIPQGSKFRVQRDFRRKYLEYKCYVAAGSDVDLVKDTDCDQVPSDGYNDGKAHITVVTFLHKREFRLKALVVNWHKPRGKKALENMAHFRFLWLDARMHEKEHIGVNNFHQATARWPDFQRRVNTHIQAEVHESEGQQKNHGRGLECGNVAYRIFHLDKVSS